MSSYRSRKLNIKFKKKPSREPKLESIAESSQVEDTKEPQLPARPKLKQIIRDDPSWLGDVGKQIKTLEEEVRKQHECQQDEERRRLRRLGEDIKKASKKELTQESIRSCVLAWQDFYEKSMRILRLQIKMRDSQITRLETLIQEQTLQLMSLELHNKELREDIRLMVITRGYDAVTALEAKVAELSETLDIEAVNFQKVRKGYNSLINSLVEKNSILQEELRLARLPVAHDSSGPPMLKPASQKRKPRFPDVRSFFVN